MENPVGETSKEIFIRFACKVREDSMSNPVIVAGKSKHEFQIVLQNDGESPCPWGLQALDRRPLLGERIQLPFCGGPTMMDVVVDTICDNTLFVHVPKFNDIDVDTPARQVWLDGLKDGDLVVIRVTRDLYWEYYQSKVGIVANRSDDPDARSIYVDGRNFNRIGNYGRSYALVEPTPRVLNEVERTTLLSRMSELNWRRLPVIVLSRIVALIEQGSWTSELSEELKLKE